MRVVKICGLCRLEHVRKSLIIQDRQSSVQQYWSVVLRNWIFVYFCCRRLMKPVHCLLIMSGVMCKINALFAMRKSEILNRIISFYSFRNKTELATFLGVSPQTVSNWYSRNSIDYDLIFEKCVGVDLNWLVTGSSFGYMNSPENTAVASDVKGTYEVPVLHNRSLPVMSPETVYGVDGRMEITGYVSIPEHMLADGEYMAFLADDAMPAYFKRGDYVVCKRIVDFDVAKTDETKIYVLAVAGCNLMFRRIIVDKTSGHRRIVLTADNENKILFPDMTVGLRDIVDAWEIKFAITSHDTEVSDMYKRLHELEKRVEELTRAFGALANK